MMNLSVKRPTPTTVSYTVSTRSVNRTIPDQVQRVLIATIRILIGVFTSLLLLKKVELSHLTYITNLLPLPEALFHPHSPGRLAHFIASVTPWKWILPASFTILWLVFRKGYTEESLLVIRGLGVQTSTSSTTYLSTSSTRFIPTSMIQDIFIHEAFKGFEVKFYLAIVVEGEEDAVVIFPVCLDYA